MLKFVHNQTVNDAIRIFLILAAWLIAWQLLFKPLQMNPVLTSAPIPIFQALYTAFLSGSVNNSPNLYSNIWITVYEVLVAFSINVAIGFSLGFSFGFASYIGRAFEPLILMIQAFPIVVIFPIIVLFSGVSFVSNVILAILIGLPYLVFNVASAIRSVNQDYYKLGRSMGFSTFSNLRRIIFPEASPYFLQGLRLCFAYTYVGVIVAQIIYVSNGLGYLVFWASTSFFPADLFAFIAVIVAFGVLADFVFRVIDYRLLSWKY